MVINKVERQQTGLGTLVKPTKQLGQMKKLNWLWLTIESSYISQIFISISSLLLVVTVRRFVVITAAITIPLVVVVAAVARLLLFSLVGALHHCTLLLHHKHQPLHIDTECAPIICPHFPFVVFYGHCLNVHNTRLEFNKVFLFRLANRKMVRRWRKSGKIVTSSQTHN